MGNLCCKPSKKDNFSSPGRVVGAAPTPPSKPISKIPSPLTASMKPQASSPDAVEAKKKAAEAAEARAAAQTSTSKQGKLGEQLAEQKKQARKDTLNQVSEENRRHRDMDASTEIRTYS